MSNENEDFCIDCGRVISNSSYPYHNADHSFRTRKSRGFLEEENEKLKNSINEYCKFCEPDIKPHCEICDLGKWRK